MEFSDYKLKIKAFLIDCEQHAEQQKKIKEMFPNIDMEEMLHKLGVEVSNGMKFVDILNQLCTATFHGYASLLFILEFECFCNMEVLLKLLYNAINSNERLRYITKIVVAYSYMKLELTQTHYIVTCTEGGKRVRFKLPSEETIRKRFPDLQLDKCEMMREKPAYIMIKVFMECANVRKQFVDTLRQHITMRTPLVDNLILIQCKKLALSREQTIFLTFMEHLLEFAQLQSVQEMIGSVMNEVVSKELCEEVGTYAATSSGGCYVFNINPALAIIINHLSFSSGLEVREASKHDLESLQKTFTSKKIPYLILHDGSAQDVKRMMAKVQHTHFGGIKHLYVVVMSHGEEGDIINTRSGTYGIREDVIAPLLANASLQHVQKFVLVNACRGSFDPLLDDEEQPLQVTDTSSMDERLAMLFSAQKGCVSLRPEEGAIFVQKFCEVFKEFFQEAPMAEIASKVEAQLLQEWSVFDRITEYCARPGAVHNIKMEFENLKDFEELLQVFCNYVEANRERQIENEAAEEANMSAGNVEDKQG